MSFFSRWFTGSNQEGDPEEFPRFRGRRLVGFADAHYEYALSALYLHRDEDFAEARDFIVKRVRNCDPISFMILPDVGGDRKHGQIDFAERMAQPREIFLGEGDAVSTDAKNTISNLQAFDLAVSVNGPDLVERLKRNPHATSVLGNAAATCDDLADLISGCPENSLVILGLEMIKTDDWKKWFGMHIEQITEANQKLKETGAGTNRHFLLCYFFEGLGATQASLLEFREHLDKYFPDELEKLQFHRWEPVSRGRYNDWRTQRARQIHESDQAKIDEWIDRELKERGGEISMGEAIREVGKLLCKSLLERTGK